jgi:broad specificity phosphatase PhoE
MVPKHNMTSHYVQANVDLTMYSRVADHAVPLSARGEQQAIAAGEKIGEYLRTAAQHDFKHANATQNDSQANVSPHKPPDGYYCRLWTSPYLRARQTAELIRTHSGGWVSDVRENLLLVEQQFGLFEGSPVIMW